MCEVIHGHMSIVLSTNIAMNALMDEERAVDPPFEISFRFVHSLHDRINNTSICLLFSWLVSFDGQAGTFSQSHMCKER